MASDPVAFLRLIAPDQQLSVVVLNAVALVAGYLCTALLLPVATRLALRWRVLDIPDGARRIHTSAVPRLGGAAVFLGTWASIGLVSTLLPGKHPADWLPFGSFTAPVIATSVLVFATGFLDDIVRLAPIVKLLLQSVAALLVASAGLVVSSITLAPGMPPVALGEWAIPVTVLWIVGVTNAMNLIDGLDGLAAACTFIALGVIVFSDAHLNGTSAFIVAMPAAGAVLAFAQRNRHPASIFLGDSGSMTLGFFLATRSMIAGTGADGNLYWLVPLVALAYPITDTAVAILRRLLRGDPISRADGRHMHHQLVAIGFSVPQAVWVIAGVFSVVALFGLTTSFAPAKYTLLMAMASVVAGVYALWYMVHWLGYGEFRAFGSSVGSVMKRSRTVVQQRIRYDDGAVRVRAARRMEEVEASLAVLADGKHVLRVALEKPSDVPVEPLAREPLTMEPVAKLVYPLRCRSGVTDCPQALVVWTSREGMRHRAGERLASTVGPAVEAWLQHVYGETPNERNIQEDAMKPMELHRQRRGARLALWLVGAVLWPAAVLPAQTENVDSLRAKWRIVLPPDYLDQPAFPRSLPGMNASTPTASGPAWGDLFVGAGYQARTRPGKPGRPTNPEDGAVVLGFGAGNARVVGLEVALTSYSTLRSGLFNVNGVSLKLHRTFASGWAVATGSERAFVLGGAGDGGRSNYVAASRMFWRSTERSGPFSAVGVTVGIGDGRYRPRSDVIADNNTIGVFGALGLRVTDALGVAADWNGQDLTVAASVVPFRCLPLTITPGVTDLTRNAGSAPRFVLGMGMGLNVRDVKARVRSC